MEYRDLPAADRARRLVEVTSPLLTLVAESLAMLRGREAPELVLQTSDGSLQGRYGLDLWHLLYEIDADLEAGATLVGYRYDSVNGTVRETMIPGDKDQIATIKRWEEETLARKEEAPA